MNGFATADTITGKLAIAMTFNSIEWILDQWQDVPKTDFQRLSIPLNGFYSIEPPAGGSMYIVWGRVFKLFAFTSH